MGRNHTALWIAAIVEGLVAGPLIALLADSLFVPEPQAESPPTAVKHHVFSRTGERLENEKELLDALAAQRAECRRPGFGIASEERIIWRELLDLELQDLDEQMSRLREEIQKAKAD